jgi:hypothetical protein
MGFEEYLNRIILRYFLQLIAFYFLPYYLEKDIEA